MLRYSNLSFFKMAAVCHFEFVVFFTVQNLVSISSVILIMQKFEYFCFSLKMPIQTAIWGVLGVKIGDSVYCLHFYPYMNAITQN